jgi:hypothetical protein
MRMSRRTFQFLLFMSAGYPLTVCGRPAFALSGSDQDLTQPFEAQVRRLLAALDMIGDPLPPDETARLNAMLGQSPRNDTVSQMEAILDRHVLLKVNINPEARVSMTRGDARAELVEHGWRSFLVKVTNQAADTAVLRITSPQAGPMGRPSGNDTEGVEDFTIGAVDAVEAQQRWIALDNWTKQPLQAALSGLAIEYRILQIYSRDRGQREATLVAVAGPGEQDLDYASMVPVLFECAPATAIHIHIQDASHGVAVASLLITDKLDRVYPVQAKRALPDLWFQPQIYRKDGETIELPSGAYVIEYGRGPEYLRKQISLDLSDGKPASISLPLERWVDPETWHYYSGDSHIHAAGCSHYESPSEGVTPEVMQRQSEGEALDVGAVLTWAPGWRYQSQFFSGHVLPWGDSSAVRSMLRYDVEVSGFPSSHCGHLVLLRLHQDTYPGAKAIDEWPSWNLPILRWAKAQGAVTGYAHSGWGMAVDSTDLPNYLIPAFDSCGANECIIDVTHEDMIHFLSGCDTWPFVELNTWYHLLNCGFTIVFAGETDFPCITDRCTGGGRSYVRLSAPPAGDAGYSDWVQAGMVNGDSYFGDGRSHIFDLKAEAASSGASGDHIRLREPSNLHLVAHVCALLEEISEASSKIQNASPYDKPYWHLERSRIGKTNKVPVDLVVNGRAVQSVEIVADGKSRPVSFDLQLEQSSWVALRIYPSCHTNPIYVHVGGKPVRASRKSAEWCRKSVDACWRQKSLRIRPSELNAAQQAYDHARSTYDRIISECAS